MQPPPSPRAKAIAEGLIRSGRGSDPRLVHGHLRLRAKLGGFDWIASNGARLLRGDELDAAEELQSSFTEAMAQTGGTR